MSETSPFLSASEETMAYEKVARSEPQRRYKVTRIASFHVLMGIAVISIITNIIQAWYWAQAIQAGQKCKLPLTGLELNTDMRFGGKTAYGEISDLTATDELWYSINTIMGVVALPNELHLGSTFQFPWDTSNGVYVLNSYHSLHCLQAIYSTLRKYQQNNGNDRSFGHIAHCLDMLRSDIMCIADDTPLSFNIQTPNMTEWPPKRKCRDWNQLADYAERNSACFRHFSPSDPRHSTLAEFTYCPEGSPYQTRVNEFKALNST